MKSIENALYDGQFDIKFIKHVPVPERPALISKLPSSGYTYSSDYTAYEHHFSGLVMESCEFVLYDYMLNGILGVRALNTLKLILSGANRVRSRVGLKAVISGRRMSGEMCTSLGNGFANALITQYIVHKNHGHVRGFVEGDDSVFNTDVPLNSGMYAALGFSIKMVQVAHAGEASFCGLLFGNDLQAVRDPRKFLGKFGWTHSSLQAGLRVRLELLKAKSLSALYETPSCPIVSVLAHESLSYIEEQARSNEFGDIAPRFISDGYHEKPKWSDTLPKFEPTRGTREFFAAQFGVSVEDQLQIEKCIRDRDMTKVSQLIRPHRDMVDYEHHFVNYVV
jgi:hypothetical protein